MQHLKIKRFFRLLALWLAVLGPGPAFAASELAALGTLSGQHLASNTAGTPIAVRSVEQDGYLSATAYGLLDHDFESVAEALADPAAWCEFVPLNFNVKACTHQRADGQTHLTFYAGRKHYQPPDDAHQLEYQYAVTRRDDDHLKIVLSAEQGPFGTRDYLIELEITRRGQQTLMRIDTGHRPSWMSAMATEGYLATLGRDKVGFSVVGTDPQGEPIYVSGIQGIAERNAMRYYLALRAFLDTQQLPAQERFNARLHTWFQLSEVHARQLHELDWDEYLTAKRREHANQMRLQQAANRFP